MKKKIWLSCIIISGLVNNIFSQSLNETSLEIKAFRGFYLGMPLTEVKEILKKDPYFNYQGDEDVYFLPAREQLLIECSGNGFIRRAFFQFYDKKLFSLILDLDEQRLDFFTLFNTLQAKYGLYVSFSPQAAIWEKNGVRLSLEKPLTIKYLDLKTFKLLKEKGKAEEISELQSLKDFLNEF